MSPIELAARSSFPASSYAFLAVITVASFDFTPAVSSAAFIDVISFPAALTVAPAAASVFN